MKSWVKETIKKYGWMDVLDYCIDCEMFICSVTKCPKCGAEMVGHWSFGKWIWCPKCGVIRLFIKGY